MKLLIIIILLSSFNAHAKKYRKNAVDRAHRKFSKRILFFSNEVDAFFADDKHAGLPNKSKLKLPARIPRIPPIPAAAPRLTLESRAQAHRSAELARPSVSATSTHGPGRL